MVHKALPLSPSLWRKGRNYFGLKAVAGFKSENFFALTPFSSRETNEICVNLSS